MGQKGISILQSLWTSLKLKEIAFQSRVTLLMMVLLFPMVTRSFVWEEDENQLILTESGDNAYKMNS
jgi:hypothetical protein